MTTTLDPLALLAEELDPTPHPYRHDPVGWARDKLGVFLWSKQKEIAQSIVENKYTAVHSCHSSGKSFELGYVITPWWVDVHPLGEAIVVTSAPSAGQVEGILWQEIGRAHRRGDLPGRITGGGVPKWWIGDEMVAFGRKPQDLVNEEEAMQAFQGYHRKFVLVVLDEAGGIPGWLWNASQALVTNEHCRMVVIGNPDDPTSRFKQVCTQSDLWNVIHIDGYDTPLFTGEPVPEELKYLLLSPGWAEDMEKEWGGQDSPLYQSKVRGRFPEDSQYGAIPWSFLTACRNLDRTYTDFELQPSELGVDPAAGGDMFSIHWRTGPKWRRKWGFGYKDTMRSVGEVVRIIEETGATRVKIDTIGVGKGVADRLAELRGVEHDADIVPVQVSVAPRNPRRFRSLRDELWWEVGRKMLERQQADLADLDEVTAGQLTSVRYEIGSTGRVEIEPKDETKKRLRRSPDDADAFLLAYYVPGTGGGGGGSVPTGPPMEEPTVQVGNLKLKGRKYVDRD